MAIETGIAAKTHASTIRVSLIDMERQCFSAAWVPFTYRAHDTLVPNDNAEIGRVQHLITDAEVHIARQRELISLLEGGGLSTEKAKAFLAFLIETKALSHDHLSRLRKAKKPASRS